MAVIRRCEGPVDSRRRRSRVWQRRGVCSNSFLFKVARRHRQRCQAAQSEQAPHQLRPRMRGAGAVVVGDGGHLASGDRRCVSRCPFSDNQPTVSWVERFAARGSLVADQLLRVLALRMRRCRVLSLTTMHAAGSRNRMTDIPSCSFGSEPKWHCASDQQLLALFDSMFPLPNKNCWTAFQISSDICMRLTSVLRMTHFKMPE